MKLAIRGFARGRREFEDIIEYNPLELDELLPDLAKRHAAAMASHKLHMIEVEFRFGTDPGGMIIPIEINLGKPYELPPQCHEEASRMIATEDGFCMELFVVYSNPSDFPGKFVLRRHIAGPPDRWGPNGTPDPDPIAVCSTLDEARSCLPPALCNIGRYREDDPVIVEVWV